MKSSTRDKIEGTVKQVSGAMKEHAGRATNDPDLQDRGTLERTEGRVQSKVGDIKKVFNQ